MDNKKNTIQFDPGYAPLVIDSIGQIGYTYYAFSAIGDIKTKKANFPLLFKKIEKLLKINITFYLGCMLWAEYLVQLKDYTITGNKLLGEVATEEEYTSEINFLIDFIENKLKRECKYFLNKDYTPDKRYLPILKAYKEFLILNKGFCDCSNTNQIILPKNLKNINKDEAENIYNKIQEALKNKNIEALFDCYNIIFE